MLLFSFFLTTTNAIASDQSIILSVGSQRFIDGAGSNLRPGFLVSLEYLTGSTIQYGFQASQSIHNGRYYEEQIALGCSATQNCIQGDSILYTVGAIGRFHTSHVNIDIIPSVTSIPLLMDPVYYEEKIVPSFGAPSSAHQGFKPGVSSRISLYRESLDKNFSYGLYGTGSFIVGFGSGYGFGIILQSQ